MNDTDILLDTLGDVDDELIPDISDIDIREKGRKNQFYYLVPVAVACVTLILIANHFENPKNFGNPEIDNLINVTTALDTEKYFEITTCVSKDESEKRYSTVYTTTQPVVTTISENSEKLLVTDIIITSVRSELSEEITLQVTSEKTELVTNIVSTESVPVTSVISTLPEKLPEQTTTEMVTNIVSTENVPVTSVISTLPEKLPEQTTTEMVTNIVSTESVPVTSVTSALLEKYWLQILQVFNYVI